MNSSTGNLNQGFMNYIGKRHNLSPGECLCNRPRRFVFCNVCGYVVKGRIRYFCPEHPMTVFLCDITRCPICQAQQHLLTETSEG